MGAASVGMAQQAHSVTPAPVRQSAAPQHSAAQQRYQQAVRQSQVQQQLQQNQVEHQLQRNATQLGQRPANATNPVDPQSQMVLQAQDRAYQARQRAAVDQYNRTREPVVQKPSRATPEKPPRKKH